MTFDAYNDLTHPQSLALQKRYIASVIDKLNDLDNILWRLRTKRSPAAIPGSSIWPILSGATNLANGGSTLSALRAATRPTMLRCTRTTADWISPGDDVDYDPNDPPASTGRHIIVSDSDHHLLANATVPWVWKSFLRGEHPIPHGK